MCHVPQSKNSMKICVLLRCFYFGFFLNGVCLDGMPMKKRGHIYSLEDIRESNGPDSTVKIVCETQIYVVLKNKNPVD